MPVKHEPQSLHWNHQQVIIHSGIVKQGHEKSYHPFLSNDQVYDHVFVKYVLTQMLNEMAITPRMYVLIKSDNCTSQYKSAKSF